MLFRAIILALRHFLHFFLITLEQHYNTFSNGRIALDHNLGMILTLSQI